MAIAELNQILLDHCKINLTVANELVIKEDENLGRGEVLKKVVVKHCNSPLLAIKLDKYKPTTKYFKLRTADINKGCDCVIFLQNYNDKNYILFCELKSKTINKTDVANKFICSSSFVKYMNHILNGIYGIDVSDYITGGITFKIKNQRIKKSRVRPQSNFDFSNDNYNYKGKAIQVLEITKDSPKDYKISLDVIVDKLRTKKMKNWP